MTYPDRAPPGIVLMTVGQARREFPDQNIGRPLAAWGDSPAVPRDPDDWWVWILEGGREITARNPTREHALMDSWRVLWWRLEMSHATSAERKRQMAEAKIAFLMEQGWGFPSPIEP